MTTTRSKMAAARSTTPSRRSGISLTSGEVTTLPDGTAFIASYHPSRQNTNTGKLTWEMWIGIFRAARAILSEGYAR